MKWRPDPKKFAAGEFEGIMQRIADAGVKPGIWTCPQFWTPGPGEEKPDFVHEPGFYRDFIDGHLIDMAGMDFSSFLVEHVADLQSKFLTEYWKYDQDFFTENDTRHGRMKNVIALEDALRAVRRENPDLYIENCQSGGRMITEFNVLLTQGQWIADGGGGGAGRVRDNMREALGAVDFLPPWTVIRWANRPEEDSPEDEEFTRMYMRSAMVGCWGVVSDLAKIPPRMRDVIVEEVARYRRFNSFKEDNLYTITICAHSFDFFACSPSCSPTCSLR